VYILFERKQEAEVEVKRQRNHSSPTKSSPASRTPLAPLTNSKTLSSLTKGSEGCLGLSEFRQVVDTLDIPIHLTNSLYAYIVALKEEDSEGISFREFAKAWKKLKTKNSCVESLCFDIITRGNDRATFDDIQLVIRGKNFCIT
jgi:hypothetical protein